MTSRLFVWLRRTPLGSSLGALRGRERGLVAFLVTLAAVAATTLSTQVSDHAVRALIANHHLRPASLPVWAWLQLTPKMYSFGNQCWLGDSPLLDGRSAAGEARFAEEAFWVNHYPARRARFDASREGLAPGRPRHVVLRSSYQGLSVTSSYAVTRRDDGLSVELRWVRP